ncbi:hypothetical protein COHA_010449 [Chlorella ohadii]|uniref:Acyl-CoA dehydrogenase n=1 Tax=Chlorella ohadii TaxID=2649997 RepID=A0AAD5H191_9CHLO|nr:hypothetical protein COHA_010449 [Chlorella ohadii]
MSGQVLDTGASLVPTAPALRLDEGALGRYLSAVVPGFPAQGLKVFQFSHGQSNPTYLIKAGDGAAYVLRKKPPGRILASAHAVEREYRVLAALQATPVPVPRVVALCEDPSVLGTPFYLMEHVKGRIFNDPSLPSLPPAQRAAVYQAMARTLAALHSVRPADVGLASYGKLSGYNKRQVWRWGQQYRASVIQGAPMPEMLQLHAWLEDNIPPTDPDASVTRISHGDYRLDNLVFDHADTSKVLAVLDWELSTLGDPLADLAYNCMPYHLPADVPGGLSLSSPLPAGIPDEQHYVHMYCEARGLPYPLQANWSFYLGLSIFRLASILAGVGARAAQGNASSRIAAQMGAESVVRSLACRGLEVERLKDEAKRQGLWNLWIPADMAAGLAPLLAEAGVPAEEARLLLGPGLTNLEYAHCAEIQGRSVWAPECFNCSAPDTGNMEVLARYGSRAQQRRWLLPLLRGECRSCFAMTEPAVASSDATNITASIRRQVDGSYVLDGRKWWASGASDPRCRVAVFMGKTDPSVPAHAQQSMVLVPLDTPGITVVRPLPVFGFDDAPHGHAEVLFESVRMPADAIILGEGRGFEIAQGRLGPGRLHHCMRLIGMGERALQLLVQRSNDRVAFKQQLWRHQSVRLDIARSRVELDAARLVVLQAAHALDLHGNKAARGQIAAAKALAPSAVLAVIDRAIQTHGAAGVSDVTPLAHMWAGARTLRLADGPDVVHLETIAKLELAAARRSKL